MWWDHPCFPRAHFSVCWLQALNTSSLIAWKIKSNPHQDSLKTTSSPNQRFSRSRIFAEEFNYCLTMILFHILLRNADKNNVANRFIIHQKKKKMDFSLLKREFFWEGRNKVEYACPVSILGISSPAGLEEISSLSILDIFVALLPLIKKNCTSSRATLWCISVFTGSSYYRHYGGRHIPSLAYYNWP